MTEKKLVKCVLGQRKKIARAMAIYAYDFRSEATEPNTNGDEASILMPLSWRELSHKEAEHLVELADRHIEKLLDGGTIFPFVMGREVEK